MKCSTIDFLKLEKNNTIRESNTYLANIENELLLFFKRYKVKNINYFATSDLLRIGMHIVWETYTYKQVDLYIHQEKDSRIHITIKEIYNTSMPAGASIRFQDYLNQRNYMQLYNELQKCSYVGTVKESYDAIHNNLVTYFRKITEIFDINEVDMLMHTDYWTNDVCLDWR